MTSRINSDTVYIQYGFCEDVYEESLIDFLSPEEKKRAYQIQSEHEQRLFITTRATLRSTMADHLAMEPDAIPFYYGINGKPFVKSIDNIQFSVSHSMDFFVEAFIQDKAIGVDVEFLNREFDLDKLSGFLLTSNELQKFQSSYVNARSEHFINCWTRKEAVLKAMGSGFSFPPSQLEVSFLKDEIPNVLATQWPGQSDWHLESLDFPGKYRGAVAVHGKVESIVIERMKRLHFQQLR